MTAIPQTPGTDSQTSELMSEIDEIERGLLADPTDFDMLLRAARWGERTARYDEARRFYMHATAVAPTRPEPIVALTRDMLKHPVTISLQRKAAPAAGITQAVYPVPQDLKSALLTALLERGHMEEVLVFTRTKHRADRLFKQLVKQGIQAERIHGNRSQAQRTEALAGFRNGKYRVLVATDSPGRSRSSARYRPAAALRIVSASSAPVNGEPPVSRA